MAGQIKRTGQLAIVRIKRALGNALGWVVAGLLQLLRHADRRRLANGAARFMRHLGPWLTEHRTARANLVAAFPEKSAEEIEKILIGSWDNLGRVAGEFPQLDRLTVLDIKHPAPVDVAFDQISSDHFLAVREGGRPTLFFAGHLGNWELPALVATSFNLDTLVLYRPPSVRAISDAIVKIRAGCMGTLVPSFFDAPIRLARALEQGRHVGMLVDQYDVRGVDVTFFGRTCKANPLIAQLARHLDCDIRGTRIIRQPDGHHFWIEFGEVLDLPRDVEGRIDIAGTMQLITTVLEGWVREHPEQWLWQHRRWR